MNKIIFLVFLFPLPGFSQTPFGYHATWYFSYSEFGYGGYKKMSHISDTTMFDLDWLKFEVTGLREWRTGPYPNDILRDTSATFDPIYLATKNDSVFRLLNDTTPYLLYDFSGGVGDEWQFAPQDSAFGCDSLAVARIVNMGIEVYGSDTVSYIEIDQPQDTSGFRYMADNILPPKIFKEFGSMSYSGLFHPSPNSCDGSIIDLNMQNIRCFSNDHVSINFTSIACDYWYISADEYSYVDFKIFPNPAHDIISIEVEGEVKLVEILSLRGKKLLESKSTEKIKLPEAAGVYLVVVYTSDGGKRVSKVVKR